MRNVDGVEVPQEEACREIVRPHDAAERTRSCRGAAAGGRGIHQGAHRIAHEPGNAGHPERELACRMEEQVGAPLVTQAGQRDAVLNGGRGKGRRRKSYDDSDGGLVTISYHLRGHDGPGDGAEVFNVKNKI